MGALQISSNLRLSHKGPLNDQGICGPAIEDHCNSREICGPAMEDHKGSFKRNVVVGTAMLKLGFNSTMKSLGKFSLVSGYFILLF